MDERVFLYIHGLAGRWIVLDAIGIFFARYALFLFGLFFIYRILRKRTVLVYSCVAGIGALAVNQLLGYVFFRPRPFMTLDAEPLISVIAGSKSFPSDHTAVAWTLATVIGGTIPALRLPAYACAFAISLARAYVGVHYPLDIIGGIAIGAAWGMVALICIKRFPLYGRERE
jgi:undecaprenyl-diphosphatase